jgi:putative CocE/NonD family hydrolase
MKKRILLRRSIAVAASGTLAATLGLSSSSTAQSGGPATGVESSQVREKAQPTTSEGSCSYAEQSDVPSRMRDGTILRSNVFTPDGPGEFPVILMRLPYDKDAAQTYVYEDPGFYASHCYIVVIQDVRGQYKSGGFFYTFRNEAKDGYDTIEWAARLPHSNGKVGMYGFSYVGATQWLPATLKPPHLVTIVPAMTSSDYYDGWTYEGGALDQSFVQSWPLGSLANSHVRRYPDGAELDAGMNKALENLFGKWYWHLPLDEFPPLRPDDRRVAPYYFDWIKHPTYDRYWKQWSIRQRHDQVEVPTLNFDGWYDIFVKGAIENYEGMKARGGSAVARHGTKLVVGPWDHLNWDQKVGAIDFGEEAENPIDELQLRWFDYWLKGVNNGVDSDPNVRVFVMGANKWRTASDWPIPGTRYEKFYLHSQGNANTVTGTGELNEIRRPSDGGAATDQYQYDPKNPVPSFGGRFQSAGPPPGPQDQRLIEQRPDVLVYSTPPLKEDVEVTGPIKVTLYAASSARDTDWTAKLNDVNPDGTSMLISYGIQRARYRISEAKPELIKPHKVYKYTIEVWPTSNLFKAGHQIRLEISSSNFPMFDRNPNTGGRFGKDTRLKVAEQTVYHDGKRASSITLPIMRTPLTP